MFFQSGPGLAFLHRLVLALHLVYVEVGACGIRLVCLLLNLTGLDRFVAASYGAQQQVNRQVEHAIVDYRQAETVRLAKDMPRKTITVTQDETFTGGLCLVATEPVSNFIILEHLAQTRDQDAWNALMAPVLAQLNCEVMQSTNPPVMKLLVCWPMSPIIWERTTHPTCSMSNMNSAQPFAHHWPPKSGPLLRRSPRHKHVLKAPAISPKSAGQGAPQKRP